MKVGTNGGSFLHDGDDKEYYLASMEEVIDKFSYLPDVGVHWKGAKELTNEQLYNICMSIAKY